MASEGKRSRDLRVERASVAATELSLARCAELYTAVPAVDHGADLFAYQADPFRVTRIQVKGATGGLKVFRQYSLTPMIVSYVLDPLGPADVILLTCEEAWHLPFKYIAHSGKAGSHHPDNPDYRWDKTPALLMSMLRGYLATPERWLELFDLTAIPYPTADEAAGSPTTTDAACPPCSGPT
jgi:hypothetical protein